MSKKRRSEGPVRPIGHSTKPTQVLREVRKRLTWEELNSGSNYIRNLPDNRLSQKETNELFKLHGAFAVRSTTQGNVSGRNPMASKVNRKPPGSKSGKFCGKSDPFHGVQSVKIRKSR